MSATSVTSVSKQSSPLQNYAAEHEERKESRNVPAIPRITAPFLGDESWGWDLELELSGRRVASLLCRSPTRRLADLIKIHERGTAATRLGGAYFQASSFGVLDS
jgi:hypothetical protein